MRVAIAKLMMASVAILSAVSIGHSEPVDQELVIDGEIKMITKTKAIEGHPMDEVLSGWRYRTSETRAIQADSFDNSGMLRVEEGETLWNQVEGTAGKSCASCHGDAAESMKGVGANYPKWDEGSKKPINIELRINKCREENMGAEPYKFDKGGQKPLTAYIKNQSLSMPVAMSLASGDMQAWWKQGEETYYKRTGQLNLSCASCHEQNAGNSIRADHLSQGQINGFPTYRLKQSDLVSVHNRFRGCIRDTRAEYPAAFSDELMALEVYVTWRGSGLSVETPAVRN